MLGYRGGGRLPTIAHIAENREPALVAGAFNHNRSG
jgi:hypothetical protein